MDATINGVMQEAIEYAEKIAFLPLYPLHDCYDQLLMLHARIRQRDLVRLFWESEADYISQGAFIECAKQAALVMVGFVDGELAGACWVGGIVGEGNNSRCELIGWMSFVSRGFGSELAFKACLNYVHETLKIESIFLRSPWRTVKSLCERSGLQSVATIDRYFIRGKPETLYIYRSDAKWDGQTG